MISIIIYCVFCYLVEIGIYIGSKRIAYGSLILAPIIFPLELGAILSTNFMRDRL